MGVAESKTDYIGCIGKDERGTNLANLVKEAGVTANFCVSEDKPTGCCAVVIYNKERTLDTKFFGFCFGVQDSDCFFRFLRRDSE